MTQPSTQDGHGRDVTIYKVLLGKIFDSVVNNNDEELIFTDTAGHKYTFYHHQDCSERVEIVDIVGDLDSLVSSPLLMAEEVTQENDGYTYTFYKFATIKGYVTVRWLGESNGSYSEEVHFRVKFANGDVSDCWSAGHDVFTEQTRQSSKLTIGAKP